MKVTRFVNGNKITKPLSYETVVKNRIISHTINKVNQRLENSIKENSATGPNIYE